MILPDVMWNKKIFDVEVSNFGTKRCAMHLRERRSFVDNKIKENKQINYSTGGGDDSI